MKFALKETFRFAAFAVVGVLLFLALALVTPGCSKGGDSPTEPVVTTSTPAPVATTPAATPVPATPAATPQPTGLWWVDGGFGPKGSYDFKNKSGDALTWTVYSTSFDDQELVLSADTTTTQNGDHFSGTLDVICRQVDAQQGVVKVGERATAAPFASAFINHEGKVVRASEIDRAKCDVPPACPEGEQRDQQGVCRPPVGEGACALWLRQGGVIPSITGDPDQDNTNGFTGPGDVAPTGGTFDPDFTNPPVTSVTYTLNYGPKDEDGMIVCGTVTKTFTFHCDEIQDAGFFSVNTGTEPLCPVPEPECDDEVLITAKSGYYCLSPLGSESAEATWLGVANVGVKTDNGNAECATPGVHDIVLFKDGRADCPQGQSSYYVVTPTNAGSYCPWPAQGEISHYTVFDGKKCPVSTIQ